MIKIGIFEIEDKVVDVTNEELMFYFDWDSCLASQPICDIDLEELTNLHEDKAGHLRAMLDTGSVWIEGDLDVWDDCADHSEGICVHTYDPRVAAQFQFTDVIWSRRGEGFSIRWGEDGMAVFEVDGGGRFGVKLW